MTLNRGRMLIGVVSAMALALLSRVSVAASAFDDAPSRSIQAAPWPASQAQLPALGESLMKSWFAKVAARDATAEQLMQPGFQSLDFRGALNRAGTLAAISSSTRKSSRISDVITTRVGDALVVTCLVQCDVTLDGVKLPADSAPCMAVWQWADGAWRMAALGSLHMPAVRPAPSATGFVDEEAMRAQGVTLITAFITAQSNQELAKFGAMLADGLQSVNFKGQKVRADLVKGAENAKTTQGPSFTDIRATRCGNLMVVTCVLTQGLKIGWSTLPADPAPLMVVFECAPGEVQSKVIATANTNKPK